MIYIYKGDTPKIFTDAKRKYQNYDNLPGDDKNKMKEILLSEQGHLCAYCMSRIILENSTIEHYIPRNGKNGEISLSLDYRNLLLVCCNGRNGQGNDRHCDVSKGDKLIAVNPTKKEDIEKVKYYSDGTIGSDIDSFNTDFNNTLNLNNLTLKRNRQIARLETLKQLSKNKHGGWSKDYVEKCLNHYISQDIKVPYVGIIIYELEKRLKRGT